MPRAERYGQLLAVAQAIVEKEGVNALTMSALAERAGASKPVVYEHFENSEAVIVALLENNLDRVIEFVTDRVESAQDINEYMRLMVDAHFDFHTQEGLITRNITNGSSSSEAINNSYLKRREMAAYVFQGLLRQQGVADSVSIVAARGLSEMINTIVFDFARGKSSAVARETLKHMIVGLIQGLSPAAKTTPVTPPIKRFHR